jgi:transcriptional regulator with XRE-family HTH domain
LDVYGRPDGRRWSGQEIDEATGGVVTRSYVTNLRKGRIENPGYEKMRAIAKAMGFAPEVWFEDGLSQGRSIEQADESRGLASRLEHLFEVRYLQELWIGLDHAATFSSLLPSTSSPFSNFAAALTIATK